MLLVTLVLELCKSGCVNEILQLIRSWLHMIPFSMNTGTINKKKYISKELRPNAIICEFYVDGVRSLAEQFGLQNSTVRVRPRKGLL
jgi:hypothetical protein